MTSAHFVPEPTPANSGFRPPSLRRNFSWTLVGNGTYAACQWGVLVVIARLADVSAVGTFAFGLALTAPTFLLAGLQLRGIQATDAARRYEFGDYLWLRIAGMFFAIAVTVGIAALSGLDGNTRTVTIAVAVSKAIEGLADVFYGLLQQHERMRSIAVSLIARGLLGVLAVAVVVSAGGGLGAAVFAMGAAWAAVLLIHDVRAASPLLKAQRPYRLPDRAVFARTREVLVLALPLGLVVMVLSLRTNIPRYFLEHTVGPSELGVYAALASLIAAGTLVVSSLGQSASPRLARFLVEGRTDAFRRLVFRLLAMSALVGIAGVTTAGAAGEPLLRLVFGIEYAAQHRLFTLLMGAGVFAFIGSTLGFALTAARLFKVQFPLFATSTAACAAASAFLVPHLGAEGAAFAWGLALLLECALSWWVLQSAVLRRGEA